LTNPAAATISHTAAMHQTVLSAKQRPVSARCSGDHIAVSPSFMSRAVDGTEGWTGQAGNSHVAAAAAAAPTTR
jgi:hypothetical protein